MKGSLRVLHLIHHLRPGGAEKMVKELLPRLAGAGFEVQVACLDDRGAFFDELRAQGIPAHFVGRRRGLDLAALGRLIRLLRREGIELLNTHSFSAGWWGRWAAAVARTPRVVTTVHTVAGWCLPLKQRIGHLLLRPWTDAVVAVSESVRRSLVARGMPSSLIEVIPNGIALASFPSASPDKAAARSILGLSPAPFTIGMVARCSAEKGGTVWLQALALLKAEGHAVQGVLVGDGPEAPRWHRLAAELGLKAHVVFAGEQTDITRWLAAFDVLACPSLQESFGLAALEGQAAGVPVVATRVDGFLETLSDGENALLVPPNEPAPLAVALRALMQDRALVARLREAGRINVARFDVQKTADAYAALYRRLRPKSPPFGPHRQE